jgi:hypothetical protein
MALTEEELANEVERALIGKVADPRGLAKAIIASFAQVTPGTVKAEAPTRIDYIDISKPFGSGTSIKPGNIRLNWKKLFEKTPELVLTGAGVTQMWLVPFAALYLWNLVWSLAKVELSPDHGSTMYALWNAVPGRRRFAETEALEIVNRFRVNNSVQSLSSSEFAALVDDLVRLDCIELAAGQIWLREWIRKQN